MRNRIPYFLLIFRALLGPMMPLAALELGRGLANWLVLALYLGLFSDILDGILARKAGIATESFRRMDSQADIVFYIGVALATWILYPIIIADNKFLLLSVFTLEASCYILCFIRFRKEPSNHAWLSKLWGLTLPLAFTEILGWGTTAFFFKLCLIIGWISQLDNL